MQNKTRRIGRAPEWKSQNTKTSVQLNHVKGGRTISLLNMQIKRAGKKWIRTRAYLDSGAHTSIFNAKTMKKLGISPSSGKIVSMRDGSGRIFRCRQRRVEIKVGGLIFPLNATFSTDFKMDFNVLGMDFFSQTIIVFDILNNRVIIDKIDEGS